MRKTLYDKFLNFDRFRASVKYQLTLRNWTYKTLSAKTGYSVSYLTAMMSGNGSRKAMRKVAEALNLNPKDFK
ncbi:MAG: helix-turn-helix domain-containing protein [Lachnospiraceae bacterium]|nr:helix-turn-helix domain-containing protein [Lachnospiraceae bacterium]